MSGYPVLSVGDKIKFCGEKRPYKVRAVSSDGRYAICTKPFNLTHDVQYTVIDWEEGVRGVDNYYGLGYNTDEEVARAMERFEKGDANVSLRNWVYLRFSDVQPNDAATALVPTWRSHVESTVTGKQYARRNSMYNVAWWSTTESEV